MPGLLDVEWRLLDPGIEIKNLKIEIDNLDSEITTERINELLWYTG